MADTETRSVLFHGLSDLRRLALLEALAGESRRVNDLAELTELPQPSVSRHLACLWDCGLVEREQRGREVFYTLADGINDLLAQTDRIISASGERIRSCPRYGKVASLKAAA